MTSAAHNLHRTNDQAAGRRQRRSGQSVPGTARPTGAMIQLTASPRSTGWARSSCAPLDRIDLSIAERLVAIMGPSGSGKSTMMNILGCLDIPTTASTSSTGSTWGGARTTIARDPEHQDRVVFQSFNLISPHHRAAQRGAAAGLRRRHDRARRPGRVGEGRLGGPAEALPNELSGGSNSGWRIARALVTDRRCCCGEPTGNLDTRPAWNHEAAGGPDDAGAPSC